MIEIVKGSGGMVEAEVTLKSTSKLPRDFSTILAKIAGQYESIVKSADESRPTLHQVRSVQVTHLSLMNGESTS